VRWEQELSTRRHLQRVSNCELAWRHWVWGQTT
jgi:hypothetical protein